LGLFFWRRKSSPKQPLVERKYASAYLFANRLVIYTQLYTPFGLYASEPYQHLARDAAPDEVGQCVRIALESSRHQEQSAGGKDFVKQYWKLIGVKSNSELQKSAENVHITQAATNIEFEASHNGGAVGDSKGYRPIPGLSPLRIAIDAPSAEIGKMLLKAFSLCTSVYQ
jgi:hypothetical protein